MKPLVVKPLHRTIKYKSYRTAWYSFFGFSFWVVFLAVLSSAAYSGSLKNLLFSPGELIEGHQKLADECDKCHLEFSKDDQTPLCLDCHKSVQQDISSKKGFHGLNPSIRNTECKRCHSDHRGRNFDAIGMDNDAFLHELTNFPLKNSHKNVACKECHPKSEQKPGHRFRIKNHQCSGCHEKQDPHKGKLGKQCQDCHESTRWSAVEFDHDKTEFRLKFKHKEAQCKACHLDATFQHASSRCESCHAIENIHNDKTSKDCSECHSQKRWSGVKFDHFKETRFRLKGPHKVLSCESCHGDKSAKKKLPSTCFGCHQTQDIHNQLFGQQCDSCHRGERWDRVDFDHDKDTGFALVGAHKSIQCGQCHRQQSDFFALSGRQCTDCHKADDTHKGSLGSLCQSCHNQDDWIPAKYNHDLATFPLVGMHKQTDCRECHQGLGFQKENTECNECHSEQQVHAPSLGEACETCHNPNDWRMWIFDHNSNTDFSLEGAHEDLQCDTCHEQTLHPSTRCDVCHRGDDVHRGAFGKNCQQCHGTKSFKHSALEFKR